MLYYKYIVYILCVSLCIQSSKMWTKIVWQKILTRLLGNNWKT